MNKSRGDLTIAPVATVHRMNALRLLAFAAVVGVAQPVVAHTVNECTDSQGRKVMTDRPCENPETERNREQTRKVKGVGVEQVHAQDIFQARTKTRNSGKPIATDAAGNDGQPQDQGR
jgi:hypothetical protein